MINVPSEFTPTINTIYPFENLFIFEDWVTRQYIPKTEREYLPIQWTAYHVNNSYGNDKQAIDKLQKYVDSLPRDKKYWTICQYDDGIIIDLKDLDVLQFSMSKKVGVEIPLAHAIGGLPLHFDALTVLWVFGDDACGLDAHDRHRLLTVVERQTVLAHIRGLDGNALTRPHGANQRLLLLAGAADLPDAFFEEAGALVIGVTEAGSDEPGCAGGLAADLF